MKCALCEQNVNPPRNAVLCSECKMVLRRQKITKLRECAEQEEAIAKAYEESAERHERNARETVAAFSKKNPNDTIDSRGYTKESGTCPFCGGDLAWTCLLYIDGDPMSCRGCKKTGVEVLRKIETGV